jgi:hypothetical protein
VNNTACNRCDPSGFYASSKAIRTGHTVAWQATASTQLHPQIAKQVHAEFLFPLFDGSCERLT